MDDVDRKVLALLREDGRATNAAIGSRVGLTEAAVRRRIARMRRDGTIVRFTVISAPLGPEGIVLVRCRPGRTGEILGYLRSNATEVFETSGEYDVGAVIEKGSMEEFNRELDRLRALEGVVSTVTLVRLARELRSVRGARAAGPTSPGAPVGPGRR